MKSYSLYDMSTGKFTGVVIGGSDSIVHVNKGENGAIEGVFDPLSQRVDLSTVDLQQDPVQLGALPNGKSKEAKKPDVIDYQPPSPGDDYEWVSEDEKGNRVRRWVKKPDVVAKESAEAKARASIDVLERSQFRAVREAVLLQGTAEGTAATTRLAEIDAQIAEQRAIINQARVRK